MECDRAMVCINQKTRVEVPEQWRQLFETSRSNPSPFQVIPMREFLSITNYFKPFPDLAPSDFHLFGPLKRHLGGVAFDDLISELRNWFDNLDVDFFRVGISSLLSRWQKCIDLHGDYIEK
ncbi:histone-lysine N-methyltransferase SETMAR [Plakobranchus ocellatus]|uniref:Histone-lysine N-methyltransferase SETMAR n=1 Tax=Plakobranchus ocellatus TaxID=259542 RepID=A0AAV4AYS7_9GAST|nr:histone-lysine N-methyltransferase SETMAR [Plakobranchus ocellatus]